MSILDAHVALWRSSPFASFSSEEAWGVARRSQEIVQGLLDRLDNNYVRDGQVAVHKTAVVEGGALLKGPLIIGQKCFIAAGSLLRGGCWIDQDCVIGPGVELKSTIMFRGSKLAHFNFVGDSVLGQAVNLEAGSIVANYRNEFDTPNIRFLYQGKVIETGTPKFGALVGDKTRVGANAVIAPGAILSPATIVRRLALVDQSPDL
ncbi:LpxA family transferase [Bosea sp. RAF48]|uniref:LpxA family transferase n=1 Tax=Bosea sp. RAF48 TaxID=3237480 RepID=UPI003F9018B5